MFFKGSRYENVAEAEIVDREGRRIVYKRIRFIPETPARIGHRVAAGERLDQIAHLFFRDPELFWRICDANSTLWPENLVAEPGRVIGIPAAR